MAFPIDSEIKSHDPKRGTKNQCVRYVTKDRSSLGLRVGTMTQKQVDACVEAAALDDERLAKNRSASDLLQSGYTAVTFGGKRVGQVVLEDSRLNRQTRDLETFRGHYMAERWSQEWRDVECHYIYGPTRCGKTRYVKERHPDSLFRVTEWDRGPFDKYDYQDALLLEEFRGQIEFTYLLKLTEGHPVEMGMRYSNKWAAYHTIYLVSNRPITDFYQETQRSYPQDWDALMARFDTISRMDYGPSLGHGILTLEGTPKADLMAQFKENENE